MKQLDYKRKTPLEGDQKQKVAGDVISDMENSGSKGSRASTFYGYIFHSAVNFFLLQTD